jgi:hypothetical protein
MAPPIVTARTTAKIALVDGAGDEAQPGGQLQAKHLLIEGSAARPTAAVGRDMAPEVVIPLVVVKVDAEDHGMIAGRKVVVSGLDDWLAAAAVNLHPAGARFEPRIEAGGVEFASQGFRITVVQSYLRSIVESKSAVVVLRLEGLGPTQYFRGQETGPNWISGDAEIRGALRKALTIAFDNLRPVLLARATEIVESDRVIKDE